MNKCIQETQFIKEESTWSVLEQVTREGARKMLQLALENEVKEFVQKHSSLTDEDGRKVVAKNGYMPERDIVTGMGPQYKFEFSISNILRIYFLFETILLKDWARIA